MSEDIEPKNPLQLIIDEDSNGQRLDQVLFRLDEIDSRSLAAKMIQDGKVVLENASKKIKPSSKVETGQVYYIELPRPVSTDLQEYDFPLDILFEDEDLIVVNKPSGLVVHPAAGHENDTLVNALIHHSKDFHIGLGEIRPGIVHRLDKDTSGVMVVAKNNQSLEFLTKKFQDRDMERFYWAVCVGNPKFETKIFESEIGRHPVDRKKISSSSKHGKFAKTEAFKLSSYHSKLSLMKFKLHTGRTHQIRVHSSENHFPVLGDWTYSSVGRLKNDFSPNQIKEIKELGRFLLHAAVLGFEHPKTGETLTFYSPPPKELIDILKRYDFLEKIKEEFSNYDI